MLIMSMTEKLEMFVIIQKYMETNQRCNNLQKFILLLNKINNC